MVLILKSFHFPASQEMYAARSLCYYVWSFQCQLLTLACKQRKTNGQAEEWMDMTPSCSTSACLGSCVKQHFYCVNLYDIRNGQTNVYNNSIQNFV